MKYVYADQFVLTSSQLRCLLSRIMSKDDFGGDLASTAVTKSKAHAEAATTS